MSRPRSAADILSSYTKIDPISRPATARLLQNTSESTEVVAYYAASLASQTRQMASQLSAGTALSASIYQDKSFGEQRPASAATFQKARDSEVFAASHASPLASHQSRHASTQQPLGPVSATSDNYVGEHNAQPAKPALVNDMGNEEEFGGQTRLSRVTGSINSAPKQVVEQKSNDTELADKQQTGDITIPGGDVNRRVTRKRTKAVKINSDIEPSSNTAASVVPSSAVVSQQSEDIMYQRERKMSLKERLQMVKPKVPARPRRKRHDLNGIDIGDRAIKMERANAICELLEQKRREYHEAAHQEILERAQRARAKLAKIEQEHEKYMLLKKIQKEQALLQKKVGKPRHELVSIPIPASYKTDLYRRVEAEMHGLPMPPSDKPEYNAEDKEELPSAAHEQEANVDVSKVLVVRLKEPAPAKGERNQISDLSGARERLMKRRKSFGSRRQSIRTVTLAKMLPPLPSLERFIGGGLADKAETWSEQEASQTNTKWEQHHHKFNLMATSAVRNKETVGKIFEKYAGEVPFNDISSGNTTADTQILSAVDEDVLKESVSDMFQSLEEESHHVADSPKEIAKEHQSNVVGTSLNSLFLDRQQEITQITNVIVENSRRPGMLSPSRVRSPPKSAAGFASRSATNENEKALLSREDSTLDDDIIGDSKRVATLKDSSVSTERKESDISIHDIDRSQLVANQTSEVQQHETSRRSSFSKQPSEKASPEPAQGSNVTFAETIFSSAGLEERPADDEKRLGTG
ncbi:hypothetical protein HDV05_005266 [Chytridiales sp. JEL 0842]|nr:hypothetical protein HDV05_005266 [Chytridiales sp. JEL 0842]